MGSFSYFSPAKLNLSFRILGKRLDGYHEIASLVSVINFGDTLTFETSSSDVLTCSDPSLPCGDSNLIARALHLFRARSSLSFGIKIHLDKRIPMQAGLGGGSSNAATTLWALNERMGRPYSLAELCFMGASLGSDVPLFFF